MTSTTKILALEKATFLQLMVGVCLMIIMSGCITQDRCTKRFPCHGETKDSIVYKTTYRDTVIYITVPGQVSEDTTGLTSVIEERYKNLIDSLYRAITHQPGTYNSTIRSDTSRLKTTFAFSLAWIKGGRLFHQLFQKDTLIKDTLRKAIRNSETFWKQKEKVVQTLKEPTGFQWFQIWGFRFFAILTILLVILALIKRYIKPIQLK